MGNTANSVSPYVSNKLRGGNKNYRLLFFIKKIKQQATIFFSGICYLNGVFSLIFFRAGSRYASFQQYCFSARQEHKPFT